MMDNHFSHFEPKEDIPKTLLTSHLFEFQRMKFYFDDIPGIKYYYFYVTLEYFQHVDAFQLPHKDRILHAGHLER